MNKGHRDPLVISRNYRKCRRCHVSVEYIIHMFSSCPNMSSRHYIPMQHDVFYKTIYSLLCNKVSSGIILLNTFVIEYIQKHQPKGVTIIKVNFLADKNISSKIIEKKPYWKNIFKTSMFYIQIMKSYLYQY